MAPESTSGHRLSVAIDYLSPLPPVHSGIADYSRDLLPHLERRCDIRVLRLGGQPVDQEIVARFAPEPAVRAGEHGRIPLYHLGNNPYHGEIYELAMERPGIALLHDLNLHHLLFSRTMANRDLSAYRAELAADHGWIGEAVASFVRWERPSRAAIFALPANRSVLRRQRGTLVHSRWAAQHLLEADPDLQVRQVPMGVPLPSIPSAEAVARFRESLGLSRGVPVIGSFGFQTPIKRNDRLMAAMARPELRDLHLLLVGEPSPQFDLEAMAREAGVADRVHVKGFVPFEELETAIASCDLCVNLRYPTAGETSASLLRILALGRPAIVSDYAQFSDLPDDIALKIPLGDGEVERLAETLARVARAPEALRKMGERARAHVRRSHSPERAADAIVEAVTELARTAPSLDVAVPSVRPTSLTASHLPFSVSMDPGRLPWRPGQRRRVLLLVKNIGRAAWLPAARGVGGLAISVRQMVEGRDLRRGFPWLPLLRRVEPGGSHTFEIELRKPLGSGSLEVALETLGVPQGIVTWRNQWAGKLP